MVMMCWKHEIMHDAKITMFVTKIGGFNGRRRRHNAQDQTQVQEFFRQKPRCLRNSFMFIDNDINMMTFLKYSDYTDKIFLLINISLNDVQLHMLRYIFQLLCFYTFSIVYEIELKYA